MARNHRVRDPDVRQQCTYCQGPIFHDEPRGNSCPDCRVVLLDLKAVHRPKSLPEAAHHLKVCKLLSRAAVKVIDEALLDEFRRPGLCEWCGKHGPREPHHVFSKGMGGHQRFDIRINLISLCRGCHQRFHDGGLRRSDLLQVVADREKTTTLLIEDEIYRLRREQKP